MCRRIAGLVGLICLLALSSQGVLEPWRWCNLEQTREALAITNVIWDGDAVCFSNGAQIVRFYQGRRKAEVNQIAIWLNVAPEGRFKEGDWHIVAIDLELLQMAILAKDEAENPPPLRIMLDAGHGGEDDGAQSLSPPLREKEMNLMLTRQIGRVLEEAGMQVFHTRTEDTTVSLEERCRLTRQAKADVFISIHGNYAQNPASGIETFALTPAGFPGTADGSPPRGFQIGNGNDFQNTLLAYSLQTCLTACDPEAIDRGVKRQSFYVLRENSCPAALVEYGFLSAPQDVCKMLNAEWQTYCSEAIAEGILRYARKVDAMTRSVLEKRKREDAEMLISTQHLTHSYHETPSSDRTP